MSKLTLLFPDFWSRASRIDPYSLPLHCCHFVQNLAWSRVTLFLIYIQGCALSRKQTHLPPFPSGSFDINHIGFSLFSLELPSTHLSQCFYTISSAWNVLPSHIPTAHFIWCLNPSA